MLERMGGLERVSGKPTFVAETFENFYTGFVGDQDLRPLRR